MLIKANDVIGLKVLTMENGEKIEDVKDVIYSPEQNKVLALLVDSKGWFKDAKVILWEDIISIGKDNLMIQSDDTLKYASEVESTIANIARDNTYLTRTKVVTESGNDLGEITDIFFNDKTGVVEEFEVTQGAINDIKSGRKTVKFEDIVTVGKDATIVRGYTESDFDNQAQEKGLQGGVNKFTEKVKDTATDIKEKVQHLPEDERVKQTFSNIQNTANDIKEKAQHLPEDERVKQTFSNIQNTANDIKEKASNTMQDVQNKYNDAKTNPDNQQKVEDAKNKVQQFGSNAQQTLTNTKDTLSSKVQDVKQNVQDKVQDTQNSMEMKKRNDAAGKFLGKDILSPNDEFIGRKGELVTHKLLDKAERNDLLDQVYGNLVQSNNSSDSKSSLKVDGEIDLKN